MIPRLGKEVSCVTMLHGVSVKASWLNCLHLQKFLIAGPERWLIKHLLYKHEDLSLHLSSLVLL